MVHRPDIALDIDGVIANFGKAACKWAQHYGINIGERADRWYNQRGWFPRDGKGFSQLWELIRTDPKFWRSIEPFYDDERLNYRPACYVTTRPIDTLVTAEWLSLWGFPDVPVYTVPEPEDKIVYIGTRKFVEDRADSYELFRARGIECYLMDRPWNQHIATEHRIYSVNEVLK